MGQSSGIRIIPPVSDGNYVVGDVTYRYCNPTGTGTSDLIDASLYYDGILLILSIGSVCLALVMQARDILPIIIHGWSLLSRCIISSRIQITFDALIQE